MKIAIELDAPLQQIFFIEDESMQATKVPTLSKIERLNFATQFAILKTLHTDNKYEADHYEYMEEIFRRGYEKLYYECFDKLWTALPSEVAEQTIDILEMHRALLWSLGEKPNTSDIERVKFRGFDANNEAEYLSFAKFFTADGSRFSESRVFNSHMPTLQRYEKMLAAWNGMGRAHQLSKAQIEAILDA
ncbi:MAG: YfbU family protein [Candidatus Obscuribacter sp.]|nr:YfbU family protein [Candidatus Obscuribacter sp.]